MSAIPHNLPGAIQISGTYTIEGENVKVKIFLFKNDQEIAELPEIVGAKMK